MPHQSGLCVPLDRQRLDATVMRWSRLVPELPGLLADRPHLMAGVALGVTSETFKQIAALVRAIEQVAEQPAWQKMALAEVSPLAQHPYAPRGVFMGYDFHLTERGPQLIEINTNAGGAFINALLVAALEPDRPPPLPEMAGSPFIERVAAIFRAEWQLARGTAPLSSLALIDDNPASQYLYPEFLLFRAMLAQAGWRVVVADAHQLTWRNGVLWATDLSEPTKNLPVDLVYNRLTDFALSDPAHTALAKALANDGAVVTPHPRVHALLADKRRLVALSDERTLLALGVDDQTRAMLLAHVPATIPVTDENAAALWSDRRAFFFKPVAGYGSKATYRGDKLTRRVWETVIRPGHYVAQAYAAPALRWVPQGEGAHRPLKFDLRAYAYAGEVLLFAARLYEGQTTNFRTAGGGFAPLFAV